MLLLQQQRWPLPRVDDGDNGDNGEMRVRVRVNMRVTARDDYRDARGRAGACAGTLRLAQLARNEDAVKEFFFGPFS